MAIAVKCPCGRELKVRDELAGKNIRCPDCADILLVSKRKLKPTRSKRAKQSTGSKNPARGKKSSAAPAAAKARRQRPQPKRSRAAVADADSLWDESLPPSPKRRKPKKRKKENTGPGVVSKVFKGLGFALIGILMIFGMGARLLRITDKLQKISSPRPTTDFNDITGSNEFEMPSLDLDLNAAVLGSPFDLSDVRVPAFPSLPAPITHSSGVRIYEVRLNGDDSLPGANMYMRIYMPADAQPDHSRSCVLVAPAGSNLMMGVDLDSSDYHDETLPYALDGSVVITFSLDGGGTLNPEGITYRQLQRHYNKFTAARAGLVNARNALEFALARLPQVNPAKIYSAGHSSAGTLSLLLAVTQPKLAGSIAYAPAADLDARLGDILEEPPIEKLMPTMRQYLSQYSPLTHADKISKPLFLFHARDDSNVPVSDSDRFAQIAGRRFVDYQTVPRGGHYQPMIDTGIPLARAWILKQN